MPEASRSIGLTVLGGFLGAGKTTLLNHILRSALSRRLAVLVNDFGSINIDAELIAERGRQAMTLSNGCICCSLGGDLLRTLIAITNWQVRPEQVIVEASGVADPWRIAEIGLTGAGFRPAGIFVVADTARIRQQAADRYVGDLVRRQLDAADVVVLNKTDLLAASELSAVSGWLHQHWTQKNVIMTSHARLPVELVMDVDLHESGEPASRRSCEAAGEHDHRFRAWTLTTERPFNAEAFRRAMDRLPQWVLRAKGIVRFADRPTKAMIVQLVGRHWTLEDVEHHRVGPSSSRIVAIGLADRIEEAPLTALFSAALAGNGSTGGQSAAPARDCAAPGGPK